MLTRTKLSGTVWSCTIFLVFPLFQTLQQHQGLFAIGCQALGCIATQPARKESHCRVIFDGMTLCNREKKKKTPQCFSSEFIMFGVKKICKDKVKRKSKAHHSVQTPPFSRFETARTAHICTSRKVNSAKPFPRKLSQGTLLNSE